LVDKLAPAFLHKLANNEAVLFVHQPKLSQQAPNVFWLANHGDDLIAAAHNLFNQLRMLDSGGWTQIHAELAPGSSALALAINDRLSRAAAKRGPA
jgi:L-threonylcarbamoyladenylate synthase